MPISREEFEKGEVSRPRRVLELLNASREKAFTKPELLEALNFRGFLQTAKTSREVLELMGTLVTVTDEQLTDSLATLTNAGLIKSKVIEEQEYFLS